MLYRNERPAEDRHDVGGVELAVRRWSGGRARIGAWRDTLARQTREHPMGSLAAALGVGFVLGGGLFSRVTVRIVATGLRVGLRMAVVPLMARTLVTLEEELIGPPAGNDDAHAFDTHSTVNQRKRKT
jgi:hypothetical protein